MDEIAIVTAVVEALNATGIPFMIVGSLSSNAYGIARNTKDADFVIQLGNASLSKLVAHLPSGFQLESQIGFETVTSTNRYRMRYSEQRFLIEFFAVSEDEHDQLRFRQKVETKWAGKVAYLPRVEDVVVTKLRWSMSSKDREKDIDDVRNILAVQRGKLDLAYIRQWADVHGTRERLEQLLAAVG